MIGKKDPVLVDWNQVKWQREVCETEQVLTLTSVEECQQKVTEAKEKEIQNLIDNDVFEWVTDEGQNLFHADGCFKKK